VFALYLAQDQESKLRSLAIIPRRIIELDVILGVQRKDLDVIGFA
jgi:hypothetical protein